MKVHLIKKQTIEDFIKENAQSRILFEKWLSVIKQTDWNEPNDIISTFNNADIIGNGSERVVFNVVGNKYRIICRYHFGKEKVHLFVKWMRTHAEYTKLCNENKQYEVNVY